MDESCVPYPRRGLYLTITLPMVALYVVLAAFLASLHLALLMLYIAFFVGVALFQSYCCVHQDCPYVGRFCPGAGGFCTPASQIARLLKTVRRSETRFGVCATLGSLCLLGIVLLPVYSLFQWNLLAGLAYVVVAAAYAMGMLLLICPVCAIRHRCPGGKVSCRLRGEALVEEEHDVLPPREQNGQTHS
jgi:hypothetical protein